MKRMLAGIAVLAVFVCGMASVSATEPETVTAPGDSLQKSVTAEYAKVQDENLYSAALQNATATVTTGDGTVLTFSVPEGVLPDGITVFVRQIPQSEKDAFDWISAAISGQGTDPLAFCVYFEKDGAPVEPNGKIQVSLTLSDMYQNPRLHFVSSGGAVTKLTFSLKGGKLSFEAERPGYFVLTRSDPKEIPGTGETPLFLAAGVLGILCVLLLLFLILPKRRASRG